VRQDSLRTPAKPEMYYAVTQNFAQLGRLGSTLVVRGSGRADAMVGHVRAAVREVSPQQPLFRIETMHQVISESLADPRLYVWLLGVFAGISTLLAAAGIYGVIAYVVALRTREFGIRMALGSDERGVVRLVMGRGVQLVGFGLIVGIAGAIALTRVLQGVLYGVGTTDPSTFIAMAGLLAVVALAACWAPARSASRVDPAVALRTE
jgi:ABC-type lipoprotein release transport system permease subunit